MSVWISAAACAFLLVGGACSCLAGYKVSTHVESLPGTNVFTWTVENVDESWGLDFFAVEVPAATRVLGYTLPAPYSNPHGIAYWIMEQRYEAWLDPHDQRVVIPAPAARKKWLVWQGEESSSVYPPCSTVTFTLATDASAKPGTFAAMTATYTPQNNPHYYRAFDEEVTGPGIAEAEDVISSSSNLALNPANLVAGPIVNPGNGHTYYLLAQNTWSNAEAQAVSLGGHLATIRNEEENQWINSTFGSYGGALWIGLTDREKVFDFKWASGEPLTYTSWGGGQPDHGTGGVEDYVHIWPSGYTNPPSGKWNDYANVDKVFGFSLLGVAEIIPALARHRTADSSSPLAKTAVLANATLTTHFGPELRAKHAIELRWMSETNRIYWIQWTSSLDHPTWKDLEPLVKGTGGEVSVLDSTAEHPQGFYRIVVDY